MPAELAKALEAGQNAVDEAEAPDNSPTGAVEIVATKAEGSTWAMWVLTLFVIAACVGFLFREGIWSNVVRLVNVVFAGLLAMNFYEPLAKFAAGYQEDMHTFTAFWDLAFWICFIGFAAVFSGHHRQHFPCPRPLPAGCRTRSARRCRPCASVG